MYFANKKISDSRRLKAKSEPNKKQLYQKKEKKKAKIQVRYQTEQIKSRRRYNFAIFVGY